LRVTPSPPPPPPPRKKQKKKMYKTFNAEVLMLKNTFIWKITII